MTTRRIPHPCARVEFDLEPRKAVMKHLHSIRIDDFHKSSVPLVPRGGEIVGTCAGPDGVGVYVQVLCDEDAKPWPRRVMAIPARADGSRVNMTPRVGARVIGMVFAERGARNVGGPTAWHVVDYGECTFKDAEEFKRRSDKDSDAYEAWLTSQEK